MIDIPNNSTITVEATLSDGSTSTIVVSAEAVLESVPATSPPERIENDIEDSVVICVTTDFTQAYAGWDTTPWDSASWDQTPSNVGPRSFFITAGNELVIPAGLHVFATSEDVSVSDTRFVASSGELAVQRVDVNGVEQILGVDYNLVADAPWVAEFPPPDDLVFTGNGATSFSVGTSIINTVFRNNTPQIDGVDYNLVGTNIEFVQPAPVVLPVNATTRGVHYIGDGVTEYFETNHNGNSVSALNTFVFQDNLFYPVSEYGPGAPVEDIQFNTPPADGVEVILFTLGNEIEDNTDRFLDYAFTGDGVTTTFVLGNNANALTTWVFSNGRHQSIGFDYVFTAIGTIQFTYTPNAGASVRIRVLEPGKFISYDMENIAFTATGGATEPIPGLTSADPNTMVVFVDRNIQNGYSSSDVDYTLVSGAPDEIKFTTPLLGGEDICVRVIRSIQIDTEEVSTTVPGNLDTIRVSRDPVLELGDTVTFYHNDFPVGPLGGFVVNSAPSTYGVTNGVMTLDNLVKNGFINLTYNSTRRMPNPRSILVRMENIVDLAREDHTVYDTDDGHHTGLRILNTIENTVYIWDGSTWIDQGSSFSNGDQVLALQDQSIYELSGGSFSVVWTTGDALSTPPLLEYPSFGTGVLFGGYALGQLPNAAVDFPEAFQIIDHPGDC